MCLPVWRELKRHLRQYYGWCLLQGLHVPSRLEGMETDSRGYMNQNWRGLHVPSRLEGMETFPLD